MAPPTAHQLPAPADRPADSDGLPTGAWAHEIEQSGYELHIARAGTAWFPVALTVLVLAATVVLSAVWWDRIPEQIAAHTGADGNVTRWEEKSIGSVLAAPLIVGGADLATIGMAQLVASVRRPRPDDPTAEHLTALIRIAAEDRRLGAAVAWALLPLVAAICLMSALGWADGSGEPRASWLIGAALLLFPLLLGGGLRGLRGDVEAELAALAIPLGQRSREHLHRWRIPTVVDDPQLPLMVQNRPSNWTINVGRPAGRVIAWAGLGLWMLIGLAVLVGPLVL